MFNLKCVKLPSNEAAFTNCAYVNPSEFPENVEHVEVLSVGKSFVMTIKKDSAVAKGGFGCGIEHRKWASLSVEASYPVRPYKFGPNQHLASVSFEVDCPKAKTAETYDTDKMAQEVQAQFPHLALSKDQILNFPFDRKNNGDKITLRLTVTAMSAIDPSVVMDMKSKKPLKEPETGVGLTSANMAVSFSKGEKAIMTLTGKSMGKMERTSILNPDWDFQKMGIGGLDNEFSTIFRRAFASRVLPPELIEQLGTKHVRGILLYGPPGTGKTLIARQIGKMLNAREPQIVSGPSVLDKFVGESEANIRKLFAAAEEEEKRMGQFSGLHIIIFDEIDAICKTRGSVSGSAGVHDSIVNQLLAKMDGVDQLNNILVIGMTNRRDMIDEALLRPGRMEVQMEISLPDEAGRVQILNIHTARMREFKKMGADVDISELAAVTKNFSGAELEGLVRAAQSTAINRLVKASAKVVVDPDAADKLVVSRADFMSALATDIKPAFGLAEETIDSFIGSSGIIVYDEGVNGILEVGNMYIQTVKALPTSGIISLILEGPPNSGKTALAAQIAKNSGFPFVKVCTPDEMIGFTETAKCMSIKKIFDDAYKSELSCILVDNMESLIDYAPIGPRFSNVVLQALMVLLNKRPPKNRKLLVIGTTSRREVFDELGVLSCFTKIAHVNNIASAKQMVNVLSNLDTFNAEELATLSNKLEKLKLWIGIKKLLNFCSAIVQVEKSQRVATFINELEEEGHARLS